MINLLNLIDSNKCFELVRLMRWGETVTCPQCGCTHIIKQGFDETQLERQRYKCKHCQFRFDDLTGTIFAGHHKPLVVWILALYLMGLNLSNCQIAQELALNKDDTQQMTTQLRSGIVENKPEVILEKEVEMDEAYVVAGFKGQPLKVAQKGRKGRCRRLKGNPGRGTLEKEKPPIFGMIQRGGEVVIKMLENVRQATIKPIIEQTIAFDTQVYTDEYSIYSRLPQWGYQHKSLCHGKGEYARDEDGDGFYEVHVNTMEGFWSLLRSWLRPHRGISQDKLPLYLGFFEFVHNIRKRGKALLPSLLECLLA
jgi:transposase-like protein